MENKGQSDHSLETLEILDFFGVSRDSSNEKTPFVMTSFPCPTLEMHMDGNFARYRGPLGMLENFAPQDLYSFFGPYFCGECRRFKWVFRVAHPVSCYRAENPKKLK